MDYVSEPDVKTLEVTSYSVERDDDVHGRIFVIEMTYTLKQEWLVSP